MAKKKTAPVPEYTDLAKPEEAGHHHFEDAADKHNLDGDADVSTYTVAGPGQVIQELGKIK